MNCVLCDSKKHYTCNCYKRKDYQEYLHVMNTTECPDFHKYSLKALRFMAYSFVMKNTFNEVHGYYNEKRSKYYDANEKLSWKEEVKRKKYYKKFGYDPIPVWLKRTELISRLRERWRKCYYPLLIDNRDKVKELEKCIVCTTKNVKMKYWNVKFQKYMDVYIEDESSVSNYDIVSRGEPPAVCKICKLTTCFTCMSKWIKKKKGFSCPQCRTYLNPYVPKYVFNKTDKCMVTYVSSMMPAGFSFHNYFRDDKAFLFYYVRGINTNSDYILCRKNSLDRYFPDYENTVIYNRLIQLENEKDDE